MFRWVSSLILSLSALAGAAAAGVPGDMVDIRLLPGWRTAGGQHVAAVQMTLRDGWKTYWRAPGDAGIPPRFDWSGSRNLADVQVSWPAPSRFSQNGVATIGYSESLVLPLTVTPERPGRPIHLSGRVELGLCKEVCVPMTVTLSQNLPRGQTRPDPRIVAALAARPYSASEAGVTRVACRISPFEDGLRLRAELDLPGTGGREMAVVETDNPDIWVAQGATRREGGRLVAETELYHLRGRAFAIDRDGLRITVLGRRRTVDIQGCPAG